MGQADAGDNEAKLMTKLAPEWVRTSDPVIRSPARYRWTMAPAFTIDEQHTLIHMEFTQASKKTNLICFKRCQTGCKIHNLKCLPSY